MSDTPTADELADLRTDMGAVAAGFTEPELNRFWYRVRGASDANTQYEATLALMARSLLTNSAKLRDYSTGNTSEKMSQVFEHLKDIYAMYKKSLDRALGTNNDVAMGVLSDIPDGEMPTDETGGDEFGYWKRLPDDGHEY